MDGDRVWGAPQPWRGTGGSHASAMLMLSTGNQLVTMLLLLLLLLHVQVVVSRELMEGIVEEWLGELPPSPQQGGTAPQGTPVLLTATCFPTTVRLPSVRRLGFRR